MYVGPCALVFLLLLQIISFSSDSSLQEAVEWFSQQVAIASLLSATPRNTWCRRGFLHTLLRLCFTCNWMAHFLLLG
jgi:hypothetical protein